MSDHRDKTVHRLWYTRRDDETKGPFPEAVIVDHILLGRIRESDELSPDLEQWQPLSELPDLIPQVLGQAHTPEGRERLAQARIHADERRYSERGEASARASASDPERREGDVGFARRVRLSAQVVREAAVPWPASRRAVLIMAGLMMSALVTLLLVYQPAGHNPAPAQCTSAPAAGVNWRYCHLEGRRLVDAELSGALLNNARLSRADMRRAQLVASDIRYADLSLARLADANLAGANLTGAVLTQADLTQVNLQGADLSFANLQGADLQGANLNMTRLHKTVWIDGSLCLPGSIGVCRH